MRKIDIHSHILNLETDTEEYIENLAENCAKAEIVKCCLMALPGFFQFSTNDDIRLAMKKFPALMIGFGAVDMFNDPPEIIDRFSEDGFKGVKFIVPPENYDSRRFYSYYEKCEKNGMTTLFHTGIVARIDHMRGLDVNNNRMRPVYLDTIARSFPEMTVICAHLGNPWYEEASMSLRWNPNYYVDLSGSSLKKKTPEEIGQLLWWKRNARYSGMDGKGAWEKVLFGSDVPYHEIQEVADDYLKVMNALGIDKGTQEGVFYNNAAELLKVEL